MSARIAARVTRQALLLAVPLPFVLLSVGSLRVAAWVGLIAWIANVVRRGAPSTVRISLGVAIVANAIFFTVLPAARLWSYLIAAITLFLVWSAYKEETERLHSRSAPKAGRGPPRPDMASAFRNLSSALERNTDLLRRHEPTRLAAFVLASTSRLLARIADHQSLTDEEWTAAAIEFRHHSDSMWWLHLAGQDANEHDIAQLFPLVANALSSLGESNALPAAVRGPLTAIVDSQRVTDESIRRSYAAYVLDELPPETQDLIGGGKPIDQRWRHALLLMLFLETRVAALAGNKAVTMGLIEESLSCWDSPLLTGFDFAECPVIELPPWMLE